MAPMVPMVASHGNLVRCRYLLERCSVLCVSVCVCALCKFVIEALLAVKLVLAGFVVPQAYIRREMVHSFGTLRGRR